MKSGCDEVIYGSCFFSFVAFHQLIANGNQLQVFGRLLIQLRLESGHLGFGDSDFRIFA